MVSASVEALLCWSPSISHTCPSRRNPRARSSYFRSPSCSAVGRDVMAQQCCTPGQTKKQRAEKEKKMFWAPGQDPLILHCATHASQGGPQDFFRKLFLEKVQMYPESGAGEPTECPKELTRPKQQLSLGPNPSLISRRPAGSSWPRFCFGLQHWHSKLCLSESFTYTKSEPQGD